MVNFILLTGVSGAGKSTVCHAFEEKGYRIVENVPVAAVSAVLDSIVADENAYGKTVLIQTLDLAKETYHVVAARQNIQRQFMVLDCAHDELLARFRLTRHVHPLQSRGLSLEEALEEDAEAVALVRPLADLYIDTTGMEPQALREIDMANIEGELGGNLVVRFTSFGYKFGVPRDAEIVFDCRNVPNPYWNKMLRPFTGLDKPIVDWLQDHKEVEEAFDSMVKYLTYFLEKARKDRRNYVSIDLGCSGGQHRSVYFAQRLCEYFSKEYLTFVTHREIGRYRGKNDG